MSRTEEFIGRRSIEAVNYECGETVSSPTAIENTETDTCFNCGKQIEVEEK